MNRPPAYADQNTRYAVNIRYATVERRLIFGVAPRLIFRVHRTVKATKLILYNIFILLFCCCMYAIKAVWPVPGNCASFSSLQRG